jgi:hypothetical protein
LDETNPIFPSAALGPLASPAAGAQRPQQKRQNEPNFLPPQWGIFAELDKKLKNAVNPVTPSRLSHGLANNVIFSTDPLGDKQSGSYD